MSRRFFEVAQSTKCRWLLLLLLFFCCLMLPLLLPKIEPPRFSFSKRKLQHTGGNPYLLNEFAYLLNEFAFHHIRIYHKTNKTSLADILC